MPTVTGQGGKVTLLDMAKAMGPDGNIVDVAELLTQTNEVLLDMPFFEGNTPTGHKGTVRTGLPVVIWRSMYQGVPPSKSTRANIEDACGMLQARSEVDVDMANLNGNSAAFRLSEAQAFVESMNQTMAETLIYGNSNANPERFNGLARRYSSLTAGNKHNIIDAGGTGSNNSSIYLVVWGKNTIHGIYPKGSKVGLTHKDLGEIDAFDQFQNRFRAFADLWDWKCGLHLKDWRYVVRIANIDTTALTSGQGAPDLMKLMVRAMARIPFQSMGTPVFYASRTVKEMLSMQALDKSQSAMGIVEAIRQYGGVTVGDPELRFFGIPVRTIDRMLATEARVV